jgi:hypothetical protein
VRLGAAWTRNGLVKECWPTLAHADGMDHQDQETLIGTPPR